MIRAHPYGVLQVGAQAQKEIQEPARRGPVGEGSLRPVIHLPGHLRLGVQPSLAGHVGQPRHRRVPRLRPPARRPAQAPGPQCPGGRGAAAGAGPRRRVRRDGAERLPH